MIESLKQKVWPFVFGLVGGMLILAFGFDFDSPNSVAEAEQVAADVAYVAAVTPQCVARAQAQKDKLATVMAITTDYGRGNAFEENKWVVYPEGADYSLKSAMKNACDPKLAELKLAS